MKQSREGFTWRNSRQIEGYKAQLVGAVNNCADGAEVTLHLKTAKALIEIVDQALHTEKSHEDEWNRVNDL